MTTTTFIPQAATPASDHQGLLDEGGNSDRPHWTLDRRVPLALILTMFIQFGAIVYWVATLNSTVLSQGERINRLEADRTVAGQTLTSMQALLARIDERTAYLTDALRQRTDHK